MLLYRGVTLHRDCSCCRMQYADAKLNSLDPTGTKGLRAAMRSATTMRFNSVRAMLREQLVDNDILGLNFRTITSSMIAAQVSAGGAGQLDMFQRFLDAALAAKVLEHGGAYLKQYVAAAYEKGERFGSANIARPPMHGHAQPSNRIDTLAKLAYVELQGVVEATSQQAMRAVADGVLARKNPNRILRSIYSVMTKVGVERAKVISEYILVRAFNEASLDVYASAGVTAVGLVPEARPARPVTDAPRGPGSRSRAAVPSLRTVQRIRRVARQIERLERVEVQTAGDDRVCDICEDIALAGPYSINVARSLVPAHPRCRCVFVPVGNDDEDELELVALPVPALERIARRRR